MVSRLGLIALWMQASFSTPREGFEMAESLYQEQRYEEAVEVYQSLRDRGVENGVLYYNLGNAYFKAGELGRAVLSYERALKLMPGDEDTRANLAFANELVAGGVEPPPLPLVVRWVVDFYRGLRPGFLAELLSVSFLAGGIAITLLLSDRSSRVRTLALVAVVFFGGLALFSGASLAAKLHAEANTKEAIVLSENAYVRSGPGEGSPRLAEIHEGIKVRVLSERQSWYQVSLASGLTGWIQRNQVEMIWIR